MKKVAILISILVVALFVAPGLIGFKARNQYQEIIIGMQQAGIEVVSNDYKRGWFGARAETRFKLALPQDMGVDGFAITMHSDIVHGPLSPDGGVAMASIETHFTIDGKPLFPEEQSRVLKSRITLDGDGKTLINFPAIKLAGKPGEPEIQFSGANGVMLFDTSFTRLDLDLDIPELWVGGGEGQSLKITGVTVVSESKSGLSDLRLGSGRLVVQKIAFASPGAGVDIKIDDINLFGGTGENGENINFSGNYQVKRVAVNDTDYGPAELKLDLGNIHAVAAARLVRGLQDIRRQNLPQHERGLALTTVLMGSGPDLLKSNPRLVIERLHLKTPDGDIDGKLSLSSNGLLWNDLGDAMAVLNKLDADGSIRMPEKLLRTMLEIQATQGIREHFAMRKKMDDEFAIPDEKEIQAIARDLVEQRLSGLLQQDILSRDGIYISGNARLGGGLLSVNGKTIPLYLGR
jgi:uncharacterized protein YdgA (DUF945 family)